MRVLRALILCLLFVGVISGPIASDGPVFAQGEKLAEEDQTPPETTEEASGTKKVPAPEDGELEPVQSGGDLLLPDAATDLPALPSLFHSIKTSFGKLWDLAVAAGAIIFLVLLLIGGIMYLTSAGNDEQSKRAKTLLLDALIGLVIVVVAWPVGTYVLQLLGVSEQTVGKSSIDPGSVLTVDEGKNPLSVGEAGDNLTAGGAGDNLTTGGSGGATLETVPVIIQLKAGESGVQLEIVTDDGTTTETTDSSGKTTIKTKPNAKTTIINKNNSKTIFDGIIAGAKQSLTLDATKDVDEQVTIGIVALSSSGSQNPLKNFTFKLQRIDSNDINYVTTDKSTSPRGLLRLEPNETYTVTPLSGNASSNQQNTFTVPDGPTGTDSPQEVWSFIVTPDE